EGAEMGVIGDRINLKKTRVKAQPIGRHKSEPDRQPIEDETGERKNRGDVKFHRVRGPLPQDGLILTTSLPGGNHKQDRLLKIPAQFRIASKIIANLGQKAILRETKGQAVKRLG